MRAKFLQPGAKFDKLTVISRDSLTKQKKVIWLCRCECGNEVKRTQNNMSRLVKAGRPVHCGCSPKERGKRTITYFHPPVVKPKKPIPEADTGAWACYG